MPKIKIFVVFLILGMIGYWVYTTQFAAKEKDDVLQQLISSPYAQGKLKDCLKVVNIQSADDVSYYVSDEGILTVNYGEKKFSIPSAQLDQTTIDNLKLLGLEVLRSKKTGKIIVTYKGEEIKRWVIINGTSQ